MPRPGSRIDVLSTSNLSGSRIILVTGANQGRRRELVMTARGRFGLRAKLVATGFVDNNLAGRALRKEEPA